MAVLIISFQQIGGDDQGYIYSIVQTNVPFAIQGNGDRALIYTTDVLNREALPSYTFTVSSFVKFIHVYSSVSKVHGIAHFQEHDPNSLKVFF